jgi:ABC-2 type transport system permease protein
MSAIVSTPPRSRSRTDAGRVGAFLERDLLMAFSYRVAFFGDAASLFGQALMFAFVGRMIDVGTIPSYGGEPASYLAFVTIGIAISGFLAVGLARLQAAVANERYLGTLEPVVLTPTSLSTLQLGWLAYDLVYVPIRTAIFLLIVGLVFEVPFVVSGALQAAVFVVLFLPFVWGLGAAGAAATLVFRRGGLLTGAGAFALTITSGAYFPIDLLPSWVLVLAEWNPVTIAIEGARQALLGGVAWSELLQPFMVLGVSSAVSLAVGTRLFERAFRRELRNGQIGLY